MLNFYGGKIVYAKGVTKSTSDELQGRFYELKLSGSIQKMKRYFASFQLPASNCAYLFYHALSPEERQAYAFIRIVIEGDNASSTYEFATPDLAAVEQAMPLITNSVNDMRAGNYDYFLAKGNPQAASPQEWEKIKPTFSEVDQEYGPVKEFSLQGFEFIQRNLASGSQRLVRMAGVLVREKQSTDFTFVVAPTASVQSQYLYGFSFSKRESQ